MEAQMLRDMDKTPTQEDVLLREKERGREGVRPRKARSERGKRL
jgi:hypothetical protein